jgi:Trypsin-like serine proteases, typically periplasmic, contain C-terminal PDZ domain
MKKIVLLSLLSACSFYSIQFYAQDRKADKNETIIVDRNDGNTTRIEIRNGDVFINGEKVENKNGQPNTIIRKKIIINGKDVTDEFENNSNEIPFMGMDMLMENRPMLGVNTKESSRNDGAVVESVVPGSPAEKMGLKAGDIITKVGNINIYSPKDLVEAIAKYKAGDNVDITFERNAEFLTKNVTLSERQNSLTFRGSGPLDRDDFFKQFENMFAPFGGLNAPFNEYFREPYRGNSPKIGVNVEDRADNDGVYVNEVTAGSAADKAGIKKQDVITEFAGKQISNVDDLLNAINESQKKDNVDLQVMRNGKPTKLTLQVPKTLKRKDL